MASLQSAMDLVRAAAGIPKGIQEWLVAKGIIETTQQTPAITQLPSVRAALLEAGKEAAAAKQNAIEAVAKAAEFGGVDVIDIQGQIYDAVIGGGPVGSGFSSVISEGIAKAGIDTTGGVTLKNIASGIQAGVSLLNLRGGFPVLAALNPVSIIAGLASKAGNFSIRDIPNFKAVTIPTYDDAGVQNGTEVVPVLFGNASTLPITPEQIESPPPANVLVPTESTNVFPEALKKVITAVLSEGLEQTIGDLINDGTLVSDPNTTYPTGEFESRTSPGKPGNLALASAYD